MGFLRLSSPLVLSDKFVEPSLVRIFRLMILDPGFLFDELIWPSAILKQVKKVTRRERGDTDENSFKLENFPLLYDRLMVDQSARAQLSARGDIGLSKGTNKEHPRRSRIE